MKAEVYAGRHDVMLAALEVIKDVIVTLEGFEGHAVLQSALINRVLDMGGSKENLLANMASAFDQIKESRTN